MGCLQSKEQTKLLDKQTSFPNYTDPKKGPKKSVKELCEQHGQQHLLKFEERLSKSEQAELNEQLQSLDIGFCVDVYKRSTASMQEGTGNITPFPHVDSIASSPVSTVDQWRTTGLKSIADGHVAFILLAGGQGTRLGSSDPKGMYNIGLPSSKPLFQYHAEKIMRLQNLAREKFPKSQGVIHWFLMTSPATHAPTKQFFEQKNFFGLDQSQVTFFLQGTFPAFDFQGKIILEAPGRVCLSPDGNGGIYRALYRSGCLDKMKKLDIRYIYACSVDNVLAKVCDPIFMGYCISRDSDCGAKVLPKAYADEKVGVVCLRDGKPSVVEYSDMSPEESARVDPSTGRLVFNTGNICIHFWTRSFLEEAHTIELPFHVAKKKIPFVNDEGVTVTPDSISGYKMEQFIFDVFPFAKNMAVLEGTREEDFAPVKNATGQDSPETARNMVSDLHKKWAVANGAQWSNSGLFEISPMVSYEGEGLKDRFSSGPVALPAHIE